MRVAFVNTHGPDWIRWTEVEVWLVENIKRGEFAMHGLSAHSPYAMAIYFRTVADASRFVEAFPDRALADSTDQVQHLRVERDREPGDGDGNDFRLMFTPKSIT